MSSLPSFHACGVYYMDMMTFMKEPHNIYYNNNNIGSKRTAMATF